MMAGEEENAQRRHGAEHPGKTWRETPSHGKRLNTLRWIVLSGVKLLPNVPAGTGGTKSQSDCNNFPPEGLESFLAEKHQQFYISLTEILTYNSQVFAPTFSSEFLLYIVAFPLKIHINHDYPEIMIVQKLTTISFVGLGERLLKIFPNHRPMLITA